MQTCVENLEDIRSLIMEKMPKLDKRGAFDKTVGPRKISQTNKRRAYVYSGV